MAVEDLARLSNRAVETPPANALQGVVRSVEGGVAKVSLPSLSAQLAVEVDHANGAQPGDEVLLTFDETGKPWLTAPQDMTPPFIDVREFGGRVTKADNTSEINAALAEARRDRNGGIVHLGGKGQYKCEGALLMADIDNVAYGVHLQGSSAPAGIGRTADQSSLLFRAGDLDNLIIDQGSSASRIRNLAIYVEHPDFEGKVINQDGVDGLRDTQQGIIESCEIRGVADDVVLARNAVSWNQAISMKIRDSFIAWVQRGVSGKDPAASYSNANAIENCQFLAHVEAAICNAGERWAIRDNTFEPSADAECKAYRDLDGASAYGPVVFDNNWFGDVFVPTEFWIEYLGNGLVILGGLLTGKGIKLDSSLGAIEGVTLIGVSLQADPNIYIPSGGANVFDIRAYGGMLFSGKTLLDDPGDLSVGHRLEVGGHPNVWHGYRDTTIEGKVSLAGAGYELGFLGATPITRPGVSGSRGGNAALASLITQLANLGLITDSTSP